MDAGGLRQLAAERKADIEVVSRVRELARVVATLAK
jgi:hypothetical protein